MATSSAETSRAVRDAATAASSAQRRGTLRRHVNLTRELAVSQFKLKYTGSVLGYVWSLVKPMMLFGIMYVIFAKLFHLERGTTDFILQLLVAIVLWTFFVETTSSAMNCIAANGGMIRKAYFPRVVLVIASTLSALMTFAINLTLVVAIAAPLGKISLGLRTFAMLPLLVELYVLILGLSLLLSSLFVFYRDMGHIWDITVQVLIYGSAVIYPIVPTVPARLRPIILLNPMAQIIEDVRHALVTPAVDWTVQFTGAAYAVPLGITVIVAGLGYWVFQRLTPRFAEYL